MPHTTLAAISKRAIALMVEADEYDSRDKLGSIVGHLQSKFIENKPRTRLDQICTLNGVAVVLQSIIDTTQKDPFKAKITEFSLEIHKSIGDLKPHMMKEIA